MDALTDQLANTALEPSASPGLPGLEEAFQSLLEVVSYPLQHSDKFARLNIEAPKGVLLYGPPGVGKTHLVRAVTSRTNASLTVVQGPEILGPYLGDSERRLREKFAEAERAFLSADGSTGERPAILFIDEIDSIAPNRQQAANSGGGQFEARIVAQLLTLMDGLKSRGRLVVIGATNLPNSLDPALRRPGRFDREISIDVPNQVARAKILRYYTQKMPTHSDLDIDDVAESTNGYVGADLAALCREAATHAITTQLEGKRTAGTVGVSRADFTEAMKKVVPSIKRGLGIDIAETKWDDVGGLDDVKLKLKQAVQWPLEHAHTMQRLGMQAPRGILMYGPPGCSKTTLVKIIATQTKATFFSINGAALYSPYVGDSERTVREIFKRARASSPSVVFFDEVEAIVGKRAFDSANAGSGGDSVQERILSTLLNEMDGVDVGGNVLVVGATNRIDMMDAALLRPGRFDRVIYVPPPSRDARQDILAIRARRMPLSHDVDLEQLAEMTEGFSGADLANLSREAALLALRQDIGVQKVGMNHFLGALRSVQPSLKSDLMEYYERMQREFS
ncbi:AAA-domain-containing protein [Martensiomyces pterosporus]|nr:AAA-domain-containing protein [Martensiomyces pterosporus]